jgi:hypothetical protein
MIIQPTVGSVNINTANELAPVKAIEVKFVFVVGVTVHVYPPVSEDMSIYIICPTLPSASVPVDVEPITL